jgi:ribosomal protein L40E
MLICPICAHANPIGATHCEACFTPIEIPQTQACPNCGAIVPISAAFCGSCGFNLKAGTVAQNPDNMPLATGISMSNSELNSESLPDPASLSAPIEADPIALPETAKTQLQVMKAGLLHVQTNTLLELPSHLTVVHIGKPNNLIPPDLDVSGFPNSDIVSRVHADIRIEGDAYYIEDTGSSNGTYINNLPLPVGNKHKLRAGDRIALGKGDKVTFIFQII